jgi:hypothetical protein
MQNARSPDMQVTFYHLGRLRGLVFKEKENTDKLMVLVPRRKMCSFVLFCFVLL